MKTLFALTLVGLLTAGSQALAIDDDLTAECEVKAKEGKRVVLNCGKDAKILEEGSTVKVTPEVKPRRIEGC